jgi:hypothetical protein
MKTLFIAAVLALTASFSASAQTATVVDKGSVSTPKGIGGYKEISYAFAKGDVITLEARSNKLLDRIMVTQYPDNVLKRERSVRNTTTTFTMPEEGFVIIRFISDRPGVATIDYTVTRTPGPGGPAAYNTKINWEKPVGTVSGLVPKKAE